MPEKYQREIEEILGQVSNFTQQRPRRRNRSLSQILSSGIGRFLGGSRWGISPGRIMLGALILLLLLWWFRTSLPGLVGPLAWAAVILFILGYAFFFISPRATYEKRWRGRPVEPTVPWRDRFRRWAKGR